ncbi:MAG TPA: HEAT repeat domain-containing protein [Geobacteraceae bacterium]|nr:HEAT repeat domain-containing protein [Geobacteraceae bacterium]
MSSTTATMTDPAIERQQATAFVTDLIVCRQHIQSYPEAHPVTTAALRKTMDSLAPLIAKGEPLTLGISRLGILLKGETLAPEMAKFRDFAAHLASFGIITVTFSADPSPEDIKLINGIISRPRKDIWESGGIKHAISSAGIGSIKVEAIDPSVFTLTDELRPGLSGESADPWEIFVRKLLDGYFSVSREKMEQLIVQTPGELGRNFTAILANMPEEAHYHTMFAMSEFFIAMANRQGGSGIDEEALTKIASFITEISPQLRRAFILNICNSSRSTSGFSERLLQRLPGDALLEAMHSVATYGDKIPELVLQIMQRLSASAELTQALDAAITGPDSTERVRGLLRESGFEQFIPPAYQNALKTILATDSLPVSDKLRLDDLRKTLESESLETKINDIILEIIRVIPPAERGDGIRRNLSGLITSYLSARDFRSLEKSCRIINDEVPKGGSDAFFDPLFVNEVLDSVSSLGRENYQEIHSVIKAVGNPFVVPLLERLFAEANRLTRRFWFDCLNDLGEMVRKPALERLNDDRWFVVRNLVILLRNFNDQEVQRQIRRLVNNPHPRVRLEVLKNLYCYRDPMADSILSQDLESQDPARKLVAIQVAEMSNSPEIIRKLLAILDSGGIRDYGLENKSAVVQTLAGIGDAQILPKLKELLFSISLLHPGKHARLKAAIIRALPRFPASQARPLLEEIIASGGKTLAPLAADMLKGLREAGQ